MHNLEALRADIMSRINADIEELKVDFGVVQSELEHQSVLMQEAREDGDLTENAAYQNSVAEIARLESRKVGIANRLKSMEQTHIPHKISGFVSVGSMVHVRTLDGDVDKSFLLVENDLANASMNRVSVESPVGKKLIGKQAGDDIVVITPSKTLHYKVLEVL